MFFSSTFFRDLITFVIANDCFCCCVIFLFCASELLLYTLLPCICPATFAAAIFCILLLLPVIVATVIKANAFAQQMAHLTIAISDWQTVSAHLSVNVNDMFTFHWRWQKIYTRGLPDGIITNHCTCVTTNLL